MIYLLNNINFTFINEFNFNLKFKIFTKYIFIRVNGKSAIKNKRND